ncbi:phage holin family protein [Spirulina sp. CCNP1310]|uniref:phage holin family protein n=1 Tax=Spirulina sp. CCNP1310 TaxID=3110249 RepID=UPI003A4C7946
MWQFILTVVITAISLMIIAKLPLGIEVDGFNKALMAGVVFGLLNATVYPVLAFLAFPITFLTLGLFSLVINAIIFAIAAALVEGFSLKNGFWSALLGTIVLSILNSVLMQIFNALF